jgi:nucleoside-diphosphate-sugar epimerase
VTLAPPFVFGPVTHNLTSLDALNTSNQLINGFVQGSCKDGIPPTITFLWTDVRDLALGHVLAMEKPEAGGKRFFFAAGYFTNKEMVDIIRKNFPEYNDRLPGPQDQGGDYPAEGVYKIDNSQTKQVLGIEFTPFEKTIIDTVNSLKTVGV